MDPIAASQAVVMVHRNGGWDKILGDFPHLVRLLHERQANSFFLVVTTHENRNDVLVQCKITHKMSYRMDTNCHTFRGENRVVYCLQFVDLDQCAEFFKSVSQAKDLLKEIASGGDGQNTVYQEPQQYYQVAQNARREPDGDSLGSNGMRRYNNYPAGAPPQQQQQQQQQVIHAQQQAQRRASQGSSGSSTLSQNIYATAQLAGYQPPLVTNGLAQQQQMAIGQIQHQPQNGMHQNGQHQMLSGVHNGATPLRQAIPPAAAPPPPPPPPPPPQQQYPQTAQVSSAAPPAPPPPPPPQLSTNGNSKTNGGLARMATNPPPPPPPPPPLGQNGAAKPRSFQDELKARAEKTAKANANGTAQPKNESAPGSSQERGGTLPSIGGDLMSELSQKLKRMQNNAEVGSTVSADSTSTVSSNSLEERPPPKQWQKASNASLSSASSATIHPTGNGINNGFNNSNGTDSPKITRKQTIPNGNAEERFVTVADLDRVRQELAGEFQRALEKQKQEIVDVIKEMLKR